MNLEENFNARLLYTNIIVFFFYIAKDEFNYTVREIKKIEIDWSLVALNVIDTINMH